MNMTARARPAATARELKAMPRKRLVGAKTVSYTMLGWATEK
jgi:hypothetical protein